MDALLEALQAFFTQPGWLLPAAVSVALQLVGTHHAKAFLPPRWTEAKRDAVIWLTSCAIGLAMFVPTRWAWLVIEGEDFTLAHFVLSVAVAMLVIALMPWIYRKLPAELRQQYSYESRIRRSRRVVREPDGRFVEPEGLE